ncbi:MAG: hypothetical protein ACLFM7_06890 [Bacteroidales bacterium]
MILLLLMIVSLIAVALNWQDVKEGIIAGWELYNPGKWFTR